MEIKEIDVLLEKVFNAVSERKSREILEKEAEAQCYAYQESLEAFMQDLIKVLEALRQKPASKFNFEVKSGGYDIETNIPFADILTQDIDFRAPAFMPNAKDPQSIRPGSVKFNGKTAFIGVKGEDDNVKMELLVNDIVKEAAKAGYLPTVSFPSSGAPKM